MSSAKPTMREQEGSAGVPSLPELHRVHYRSLVRMAAVMLGDLESAEDVTQEAFLQTHLRWDRLREPERALAYLRGAVLNRARSRLRRRRVASRWRAEEDRMAPSAEEGALVDERQAAVVRALRRLPARQPECVVLRFYLDLPGPEIAAALGISEGSVKTHLHRALAALAQRLEVGT